MSDQPVKRYGIFKRLLRPPYEQRKPDRYREVVVLATDYDRDIKALEARCAEQDRVVRGLTEQIAIADNILRTYRESDAPLLHDRVYLAILKIEEDAVATIKRLRDALETYGIHDTKCALATWRGGRPIKGGGYESNYGGAWYPRGEEPECTCGLEAALKEK